LEFEPGAWFAGACGLALVLALSQVMAHGLGLFGRADLHPRHNPLDRQGRFAPDPGSDGQLAGGAVRSLKSKVQGPKSGADEWRGAYVMVRGNQGRAIYADDCDRKPWLATLGGSV
jgi:hypothetical protein